MLSGKIACRIVQDRSCRLPITDRTLVNGAADEPVAGRLNLVLTSRGARYAGFGSRASWITEAWLLLSQEQQAAEAASQCQEALRSTRKQLSCGHIHSCIIAQLLYNSKNGNKPSACLQGLLSAWPKFPGNGSLLHCDPPGHSHDNTHQQHYASSLAALLFVCKQSRTKACSQQKGCLRVTVQLLVQRSKAGLSEFSNAGSGCNSLCVQPLGVLRLHALPASAAVLQRTPQPAPITVPESWEGCVLVLSSTLPLLLLPLCNMADLHSCWGSAAAFTHCEVCHVAAAGPGACVAAVLHAAARLQAQPVHVMAVVHEGQDVPACMHRRMSEVLTLLCSAAALLKQRTLLFSAVRMIMPCIALPMLRRVMMRQ